MTDSNIRRGFMDVQQGIPSHGNINGPSENASVEEDSILLNTLSMTRDSHVPTATSCYSSERKPKVKLRYGSEVHDACQVRE